MRSTPGRPSPRPRRRSIPSRKAARNTAWTACSGCMMPLPGEWINSLTRRFWKPTVFANVTRDMRIAKEEIFGPVLSILTYKTEAEAIEIANDTEFGLIAYVSSADPERANRVARKLAAGRVLINTVSHDPFAPFGGFKQSGIGREGGIFGLQEYLEPKAIIG